VSEVIAAKSTTDGISSYRELPLFFTSGSQVLYGALCTPEAAGRDDRVVVFCHSLGVEHMVSQRMEVLGTRAAAQAGCAAFRYDSRAHGDSAGNLGDLTFSDLVDDACAAADYARMLSGASRIVWAGIRFGCLIAAAAIGRRDDTAALALWEPLHLGSDYFRSAIRTTFFCHVAKGKRPGETVDEHLKRLESDGVLPVVGTYLYSPLSRSAHDVELGRSLLSWSGDTLIAQVQRRPTLSTSNERLRSQVKQRGGKVTVVLISHEPAWAMLPLVQPQWTSESLLSATMEWLNGME
jgi:alpha/beta superfamily hydrolase